MLYSMYIDVAQIHNVRHCNRRIILRCANATIILGIYVSITVLGLLQLNFKRQKGSCIFVWRVFLVKRYISLLFRSDTFHYNLII
jgi:hypothetical protein